MLLDLILKRKSPSVSGIEHLKLIAATSRLLRMASADADWMQYAGASKPNSNEDVIELSSDTEDDDE